MNDRQRVCIIGGGITGNAFAWFLSKKTSWPITVIEKEAKSGGLAKGVKTEYGFEIDQFYHFLYNRDSKNTIDFSTNWALVQKLSGITWKELSYRKQLNIL